MKKWLIAAAAVAVPFANADAVADDCAAAYLCAFDGNWSAQGTSFGKPAQLTMRWQPVLGSAFARIDYRIVTAAGDEEEVFEGTGFYRLREGRTYDGTWFDSQGAMHPLAARLEDGTLTTYWGVEGETYGRTTYRLLDERHVEVADAIQAKNGTWREFSRNTLVKTR